MHRVREGREAFSHTSSHPPAATCNAPLTSFDAYHRVARKVAGRQSDTGDVLSLIPTHAAPTDTIMLDVRLPATHTQGVLPASMPAKPIDTNMIDASATVVTPDTAPVATSHSELVLPMHLREGHATHPLRPMMV